MHLMKDSFIIMKALLALIGSDAQNEHKCL